MEEQTYDPVLSSDDVPKWRLVNPLRPPAPGRALVLVRDGGPSLTVRSGEEIPSSRFGAYRGVFTVDMTEHRLILDIPLLSRDATFSFRSRVDLVCRVADPAAVVARGIRDMSGALYGYLRKTLQSVARDYDIAEFHETEMALNAALTGFSGDDAIRLRNIQVELLVDEDEIAGSGREYRDVVRETRLTGMRRRRHLDMIREEGVDGLIAEIMEKEGPRAALAWIERGEAEKREVRREVMRMVLERGDGDREPFEQAELERAVLDEVLRDGDGAGLFETATGRGRLRGSLAPALEPGAGDRDEDAEGRGGAREPLKGEVLEGRYGGGTGRAPDSRARDDDGTPRSRLSGTGSRRAGPPGPAVPTSSAGPAGAAGSSGPPEDEPLPGAPGGRADGRGAGRGRREEHHGTDHGRREEHRTERGAADDARTPYGAGGRAGARADDGGTERRADGTAPKVSRVRGTAKRHRPDTDGKSGERR
ncbi:hypothetical protein [Streptomyces sp. NPDC051452]|uniref:hypothetical protein n=1 Tax=Streptomyces sp. NPDC051452 TaxID=3365654 RepID=UPI0037AF4979